MTAAEQRFNRGDFSTATFYLAPEIYFAAAGFGAHLWLVFTTHPIWWPAFFTACTVFWTSDRQETDRQRGHYDAWGWH